MDYSDLYQKKRCSAADIAEMIGSGETCCTDIAASIPVGILNALGERKYDNNFKAITIHTMLDLEPLSIFSDEASQYIHPVTWFSGTGLRNAVRSGKADLMPCYYRDMPSLFQDYIDVDSLLLCVSPMDSHGYFSVSLAGSNSAVLIPKAKHIYLEVNSNVPRCATAPFVHISQVTALCENDAPLPVLPKPKIDDVSKKIAGYIADEIPDGATLQLGIGAVPEAVGSMLKDKHDLGIYTELFTDSMVELIECGAVTNDRKPIYRGRSVATLAFGSERLYRYIDDNPAFMFLPVNEVNDPYRIAMHPNFISVNAALEVDFYGQVCAESIGSIHVSGTGGQSDYVRGAVMSKGGKSFIAFPSTASKGKISRIRPTLTPGACVSTSKNDVDYIVTEYGIAQMRGCTLKQRTNNLIAIAHPDFRDELRKAAVQMHIL